MRPRLPLWLVVAIAAAYVIAPGVSGLPLSGLPFGQTGIVVLTMLIGGYVWTRRESKPVPASWIVTLLLATVVKIALSAITPQAGWLARYYANEDFAAPFEPSMDFRGLGATRIDPGLSFRETEFPVHFFNDRHYNTGVFREWSLPFSVHWTGHVEVDHEETIPAVWSANGRAEVLLDGVLQSALAGLGQTATGDFILRLRPGRHVIEVRYQKPRDTAALLMIEEGPAKGSAPAFMQGVVAPFETALPALSRRGPALIAAVLLHLLVLAVVARSLWPGLRAQKGERLVPAFVVGLLVTQGVWKAWHLVGHVWTLSGGDDWLNYEMSARDVVLHGLMMPQGGVIGRGQPFSLYPGYAYFVGLVHAVTGESLAGVVLMNFVLLAVATLIAYRIGLRLFGPIGALGGLAWLLLIEQADFVRYYTVTLFSENLYFVLAAATVWFLIAYHAEGRRRDLIAAGVAGALASWTRPSMMLLLPFAIGGLAYARWRADGVRKIAFDALTFMAAWMAAIAPITIRNYLMSGRAVLLTSGQGATFVAYNLPVDDKMYFKGFDGTLFNSAIILVKMLVDYPMISLANYGRKLGFSLGMVHWLGGSGTMHPELIATSVGYLAAIVFLKPLRSAVAWPIHAFIITHVATLMLTMPSNYGYRMILPSFVFMSVVAGAMAAEATARFAAPRWPALGTARHGERR
jgi:hypothetical protein